MNSIFAAAATENVVLYIDDISSFAKNSPMLGPWVANSLYKAISQGKLQILTAGDSSGFETQIASDRNLRQDLKGSFAKESDLDLS